MTNDMAQINYSKFAVADLVENQICGLEPSFMESIFGFFGHSFPIFFFFKFVIGDYIGDAFSD